MILFEFVWTQSMLFTFTYFTVSISEWIYPGKGYWIEWISLHGKHESTENDLKKKLIFAFKE